MTTLWSLKRASTDLSTSWELFKHQSCGSPSSPNPNILGIVQASVLWIPISKSQEDHDRTSIVLLPWLRWIKSSSCFLCLNFYHNHPPLGLIWGSNLRKLSPLKCSNKGHSLNVESSPKNVCSEDKDALSLRRCMGHLKGGTFSH